MVKIKQVSNAYKEIRKRIALQNQTFFFKKQTHIQEKERERERGLQNRT